MKNSIEIIDVGLGNVASINNMLNHLGYNSRRVKTPLDSLDPKVLILPGVGSWDYALNKLNEYGWIEFIQKFALIHDKIIIGICLGMQLLCNRSEEGIKEGLNLIPGSFIKFKPDNSLKIPHMGWNQVFFEKKFEFKIENSLTRFYHVHSYHYNHFDNKYVIGWTNYGKKFPSAIMKNNIIGFQFHPEKSHFYGKKLFNYVLKKYAKL